MSGPRDSEIELTGCRESAKGRMRITAFVLRDIGAAAKLARPGFEVSLDKSGLCITGLADGTDASGSAEVQPYDIITMIDDEFVSGMSMQEAWPLLWGGVGSNLNLTISRVVGDTKSRIEVCAVRDYNIQQTIPKPPSAIISKLASMSAKTAKPKKPARSSMAPVQQKPVSKLAQSQKKSGSSLVLMGLLLAMLALLSVSLHLWLMRNKGVGLLQFNYKTHAPELVDDMTKVLNGASATAMHTTREIWKESSQVAMEKMMLAYQVVTFLYVEIC
jgi:hypothetical protein